MTRIPYKPEIGEVQANWDALSSIVVNVMEAETGRAYLSMLECLEDDSTGEGGKTLLGFKRAPAAKGNHHAHEGGLVYHYLEMWQIWLDYSEAVLDSRHRDPTLSDERILKGIINHDLHKAWRTYELLSTDPWKTQYAEDESDKLLGNNLRSPKGTFKSLWILQDYNIKLDMIDYNVILNAEGGWSETQTYWTTVVAKMAYLLDESSGNILGRLSTGRVLGHNQTV